MEGIWIKNFYRVLYFFLSLLVLQKVETAGIAFFFVDFFAIMLKAFFATSPISIITFILGNKESSASK